MGGFAPVFRTSAPVFHRLFSPRTAAGVHQKCDVRMVVQGTRAFRPRHSKEQSGTFGCAFLPCNTFSFWRCGILPRCDVARAPTPLRKAGGDLATLPGGHLKLGGRAARAPRLAPRPRKVKRQDLFLPPFSLDLTLFVHPPTADMGLQSAFFPFFHCSTFCLPPPARPRKKAPVFRGTVAQSVEHEPFKLGVAGSSPARLTTFRRSGDARFRGLLPAFPPFRKDAA